MLASFVEHGFTVAHAALARIAGNGDGAKEAPQLKANKSIPTDPSPAASIATATMTSKRVVCSMTVASKETISRDTICIRLTFKEGEGMIIPVGKHVKISCPNPALEATQWNGKVDSETGEATIERKYTPVESDMTGFTLIVKVYPCCPQFPDGGKMSQYLNSLTTGQALDVELPFGLIQYFGNGLFKRSKNEVKATEVAIIVGGSGVTPMFRLVDEALRVESDATKFSVIDANRDEDHIIYKDRIDALVTAHPNRLRLTHILSNPSEAWTGKKGYVDKETIMASLPRPSDHTLVLICGPPPMMSAVITQLEELGYDPKRVWEF